MTKRFKGLDLVDRVPEELWTEVRESVQDLVTKTIHKKKMQEGTVVSEKALQIAEKRKEVKGKEETERYTQLKAEF